MNEGDLFVHPTNEKCIQRSLLLSLSEYEILRILDFLEIRSLLKCGICCKLLYLLTNDCSECNPSVITRTLSSFSQIASLLDRLQGSPTCAIIFDTKQSKVSTEELYTTINNLPPKLQVLYAETGFVECAANGITTHIGGRKKVYNKEGNFSVMLCAFPEAEASSFILEENHLRNDSVGDFPFLEIDYSSLSSAGMSTPTG